jgi:hypothetical protein
MPRKPQEKVADFKERIARMIRERETGKKYIMVGGTRTPDWCKRRNSFVKSIGGDRKPY